jgi:pimeloyl-ACP methyl ester carboxylesterase
MPTVEVNGAKLWHDLSGDGEVVMQVPGAVSAHEGYALVTPAMAEHFTVLDYDPRGYGRSDRPQQEYSFDVWCDDMVGLLDALGIERCHVHGGSMGSMVALRFAERFPERVRGLVLSGCAVKSDLMARCHYEVWKALARAYGTGSRELAVELCNKAVSRSFLDGPNGGEALVEAVMEVAGRNVDTDVFCAACDAMIVTDLTAGVTKVRAPTLVIVGLADVLTPAEQGPSGGGGLWIFENLTAAAAREYLPVAESGHANLLDAADVCNPAVIGFLERVEAGRV